MNAIDDTLDYVPFRKLPLWLKGWTVVSAVQDKLETWRLEAAYAVSDGWKALRRRRRQKNPAAGPSGMPHTGPGREPPFDLRHPRGILLGSIGVGPAPYGRLSELLGRVLMLRASRRGDRKRVPQYSSP
ncbi:hypothetical protein [Streptomyces sp. NPDC092370]|uniref:hypothetical protein n=1 Tax=Streptomyces sp. NPDC092370 TaxID=3366016 RepID=UPI00382A4C9C